MKSINIKISSINDIYDFIVWARKIDGDIIVKNQYCTLNGKDPVEMFSVDLSAGVEVSFPKKEVDFEDFLQQFKG